MAFEWLQVGNEIMECAKFVEVKPLYRGLDGKDPTEYKGQDTSADWA